MLLARKAEGFEATEAGHPHVGNHQVDGLGAQRFSARAPESTGTVSALALQERMEQAALTGVIIHDENVRFHGDLRVSIDTVAL